MTDYRNEDDWQIELRRQKADNKYKVCRLNCGFKLTARYVLCVLCFLLVTIVHATCSLLLGSSSLRLTVNVLAVLDFYEYLYAKNFLSKYLRRYMHLITNSTQSYRFMCSA